LTAGLSIHHRQLDPAAARFLRFQQIKTGSSRNLRESLMSAATPLIPFEGGSAPSVGQIANDHSLLKIDQELDFLLEQIEDEIEERAKPVRSPWIACRPSPKQ
jgi:hypothetical protein